MAIEMGEFFQLRRKLNLSYAESEEALGTQRVGQLATCREELTRDDKAKLTTFAGQRERDKKSAQEAAREEHRRIWGS